MPLKEFKFILQNDQCRVLLSMKKGGLRMNIEVVPVVAWPLHQS